MTDEDILNRAVAGIGAYVAAAPDLPDTGLRIALDRAFEIATARNRAIVAEQAQGTRPDSASGCRSKPRASDRQHAGRANRGTAHARHARSLDHGPRARLTSVEGFRFEATRGTNTALAGLPLLGRRHRRRVTAGR